MIHPPLRGIAFIHVPPFLKGSMIFDTPFLKGIEFMYTLPFLKGDMRYDTPSFKGEWGI